MKWAPKWNEQRKKKLTPAEAISVFVVGIILGLAVFAIGYYNLTIWYFDAGILTAFLFGDYLQRWILSLRDGKKVPHPSHRPWVRIGLGTAAFFVVIIGLGDAGVFAGFVAERIYNGPLALQVIFLCSLALTLTLSFDYMINYTDTD